jgi:Tol biopolymer transport system component
MLIYASGDRYPTPTSTLVLVDRKGAETKMAEVKGNLGGLRLSSSGSSLVTHKNRVVSLGSDIWMYDVPSGTATPLTFSGDAGLPLFLPDGKSIMFERTGSDGGAYSLALISNNSPQRMTEMKPGALAMSWSSDGKWLAYLQDVGNVRQIFVRPVLDSKLALGEPRQFSPSTFLQQDAAFSPDGRWITYTSSDSEKLEVYAQAFPGPGQKLNVSSKGGVNPAWSHNGRELFFLRQKQGAGNGEYSMMAVDLSICGENIKAGDPRLVLEGPFPATSPNRSYDVTSDGRFIINRLQEPPYEPVTKLNVVLGWAEELKRRVPAR